MLAFEFSQWLMQEKTTDKSCCTQPSCYIVPFEGGTNCSQAARPCQASVRLRHLSVNARSLEWDGMISWGEKPALAPCAQRNSHMSQRAKKLSRPLHNWFLSMQREGTSFCVPPFGRAPQETKHEELDMFLSACGLHKTALCGKYMKVLSQEPILPSRIPSVVVLIGTSQVVKPSLGNQEVKPEENTADTRGIFWKIRFTSSHKMENKTSTAAESLGCRTQVKNCL